MAMGDYSFPASSVNWLLNLTPHFNPSNSDQSSSSNDPKESFLHPQESIWYQYSSRTGYVQGGMNYVKAYLWDVDGRLLGTSRQLAVYFDL